MEVNNENEPRVGFLEEASGVLSSGRLMKFTSLIMGGCIIAAAIVGWFMGKDPTPLFAFASLPFGVALGTQVAQNATSH